MLYMCQVIYKDNNSSGWFYQTFLKYFYYYGNYYTIDILYLIQKHSKSNNTIVHVYSDYIVIDLYEDKYNFQPVKSYCSLNLLDYIEDYEAVNKIYIRTN